jgi:hypothetical protein
MTNEKGNDVNEHDIKLIVSLLRDTTTLDAVQQFLKLKGLASSGTWDDIYAIRILPAVIDGSLTTQELISFLGEVEEYGNQHIFLYQCDDETTSLLMDKNNLEKEIIKNGFNDQYTNPQTLLQPNDPEVSEVRFEESDDNKKLIFKIRETRVFYVEDKTKEHTLADGSLVKQFIQERRRFVTIICLHSNGSLEIRIPARSGDYKTIVTRMIKLIKIIPFSKLENISLSKAKANIWKMRDKLKNIIRFSNTFLRNTKGLKVTYSTGSKHDDIASDEGGVSSQQSFLDHDGENEGSNVWFIKSKPYPTEDIHVNLNGELNEFSIRAYCCKTDYNHVLEQLNKFNS